MITKENCQCSGTGTMLVCTYFIFLVVNGLAIWLANRFFPNQVALGTWSISKFWAIVHSMGALALIDVLAISSVADYEVKKNKVLSKKERMVIYFLVNAVGIWLIARAAEQFGMGISSWLVAVVLALVLDLFQGLAIAKTRKIKK